ncbi:uncharacterized protein LOC143291301 isoform X2 [Babylonia areolata]|uniref:uncharacterized protein LOC143291301 isoform X2 n=1 Tax=Babylonia areolata TaxID=304850 RepID=UPI003FD4A99A
MEDLDPEELLVCPYNEAHRVRVKRMQMHIYECRKSHPRTAMKKCPFNASHVIYEVEMRWHLATCADRHQVHSKIVQEMNDLTENQGCVETPVYHPLEVHGESWEVPDRREEPSRPWSQHVEKREPPQGEIILNEEEVRGLNARQKQQLYLKKKAEREAALRNTQPPPQERREPFRAQNITGGSRSLALFQQQNRSAGGQRAPHDIYKEALKGPQDSSSSKAIGRGRGMVLGGAESLDSPSAKPLSRGWGRAVPSTTTTTTVPAPPGLSELGWPGPQQQQQPRPSSSSSSAGRGSNAGDASATSGRGRASAMKLLGLVEGSGLLQGGARGARLKLGAGLSSAPPPPPPGMWQGGAAPMNGVAMGRGQGFGSPAAVADPSQCREVPFGGMTSQPDALSPVFDHMTVTSQGRGRGITTPFTSGAGDPGGASSDSDDLDQYEDAVAWVGEGYSQEASEQCQPFASASSMSLGSNPAAVESWAAEMDKADHYGENDKYTSSIVDMSGSADSSILNGCSATLTAKEAKSKLKKVEKKLRQIRDLEAKREDGDSLDSDQEEKMQRKADYEQQASELRKYIK